MEYQQNKLAHKTKKGGEKTTAGFHVPEKPRGHLRYSFTSAYKNVLTLETSHWELNDYFLDLFTCYCYYSNHNIRTRVLIETCQSCCYRTLITF